MLWDVCFRKLMPRGGASYNSFSLAEYVAQYKAMELRHCSPRYRSERMEIIRGNGPNRRSACTAAWWRWLVRPWSLVQQRPAISDPQSTTPSIRSLSGRRRLPFMLRIIARQSHRRSALSLYEAIDNTLMARNDKRAFLRGHLKAMRPDKVKAMKR